MLLVACGPSVGSGLFCEAEKEPDEDPEDPAGGPEDPGGAEDPEDPEEEEEEEGGDTEEVGWRVTRGEEPLCDIFRQMSASHETQYPVPDHHPLQICSSLLYGYGTGIL
jgi:hypothetical protein